MSFDMFINCNTNSTWKYFYKYINEVNRVKRYYYLSYGFLQSQFI